jgi:hypothetical protein
MTDWISELSSEERAEWNAIVEHFRRDALEKMTESAFVMSIVPSPGKLDIKFAMELGAAIMLDKPILAIAQPGAELPPKLRLVCEEIVQADIDVEDGREAIHLAIDRLLKR